MGVVSVVRISPHHRGIVFNLLCEVDQVYHC